MSSKELTRQPITHQILNRIHRAALDVDPSFVVVEDSAPAEPFASAGHLWVQNDDFETLLEIGYRFSGHTTSADFTLIADNGKKSRRFSLQYTDSEGFLDLLGTVRTVLRQSQVYPT